MASRSLNGLTLTPANLAAIQSLTGTAQRKITMKMKAHTPRKNASIVSGSI